MNKNIDIKYEEALQIYKKIKKYRDFIDNIDIDFFIAFVDCILAKDKKETVEEEETTKNKETTETEKVSENCETVGHRYFDLNAKLEDMVEVSKKIIDRYNEKEHQGEAPIEICLAYDVYNHLPKFIKKTL